MASTVGQARCRVALISADVRRRPAPTGTRDDVVALERQRRVRWSSSLLSISHTMLGLVAERLGRLGRAGAGPAAAPAGGARVADQRGRRPPAPHSSSRSFLLRRAGARGGGPRQPASCAARGPMRRPTAVSSSSSRRARRRRGRVGERPVLGRHRRLPRAAASSRQSGDAGRRAEEQDVAGRRRRVVDVGDLPVRRMATARMPHCAAARGRERPAG